MVEDLYGIHIFATILLSSQSGCHNEEFVGGQAFPLSQQSLLFTVRLTSEQLSSLPVITFEQYFIHVFCQVA